MKRRMKISTWLCVLLVIKGAYSALCPVGYTAPHGSSCYKFVTARADWFEALYSCLRAEARLVAIETAEEDAHLRGYIKSHFATNLYFWTSGTDIGSENKWIWASTGWGLYHTNWAAGQPSNRNSKGQTENHLHIHSRADWKLRSLQ